MKSGRDLYLFLYFIINFVNDRVTQKARPVKVHPTHIYVHTTYNKIHYTQNISNYTHVHTHAHTHTHTHAHTHTYTTTKLQIQNTIIKTKSDAEQNGMD